MSCIICGKVPFNETMKEGLVYDWDLDFKTGPHQICNECHDKYIVYNIVNIVIGIDYV